jgi:hypothetical protein
VNDAAALLDRLKALTPREERVLREAALRGKSVPELASWLGVAPEAAALALVRAALRFAGTAGDEEALTLALLAEQRAGPVGEVLETLRGTAAEIEAVSRSRLAATARRDQVLRWGAAVGLVALAWLLSRAR